MKPRCDPLRAFIADDLGAIAQVKSDPSRFIASPIDWQLYKARRHAERVFN